MKTKLIAIKEIILDKEIYPRVQPNWIVAYNYGTAMKSGAKFPPVVVNYFKGVCYLIDGKHRIDAYKKVLHMKSVVCEVLDLKTKEQMFLESIRRNVGHGERLSLYDRINLVKRLKDMKFTDLKISKIINMPVKEMHNLVVNRVTNDVTGKEVVLKSLYKNLAGTEVSEDFEQKQRYTSGRSGEDDIDNLISLIETGALDIKSKRLINKLKTLYQMIRHILLKKMKR